MFSTDADRDHLAFLLDDVVDRLGWKILGWVFMPNHHHLLVQLDRPNLAEGMHRMHFMFGQRWNERNDSTGHVLFRRYKSIPLRRAGATARVLRYIDLNPVRAGLCANPEDWQWGGYAANVGRREPRAFHDAHAGVRVLAPTAESDHEAHDAYARSVRLRLEETRGRGAPTDVRPTLEEILIPGDIESVHEATETWWYSTRAVARHIGCSHATIGSWLRGAPTKRTSTAMTRWHAGAERQSASCAS